MLKTQHLPQFNADYEKYSRLVFSIAVHILLRQQDAEEVVQEVFILYAKNFETVENPKYWLCRTASNFSIDRIRRTNRFNHYVDGVINGAKTLFLTISTKAAINQELEGLLSELDAKDRSILILKLGYEFTFSEIAAMLEMPESSVKSKVTRFIEKMGNQK